MRRPLGPRPRIAALVVVFLVAVALWLALISPAAADGIIVPQPPRDRPISWQEIPLAVKYHRVEVTIKDQVATTHVDQIFVNEATFPVEGVYLFPLPEDAAISSFDMWVDGQKLEGKLLGREEARAIYEDIVRKQRDPALLEYVGRGAFQARIFPIPPRGERRIELTYTQVLPQAGGLVHYRYPLNTEKFSARSISEVGITVQLENKAPLRAIYSPSHPVVVMRDGDRRASASYEARNVRPDRDFDLYYSVSAEALAVNLLSYKPFDEDGFFLLLVTPPISLRESDVVDKDVILVFDTSGSMDGEKVSQAKAAATYVLDHLGEGDRFNIVSFNTATRLFAEKPGSRLAWCYNDLGVSIALYAAAAARGRDDWRAEALALASTCARTQLADAAVKDCGLCHGAAGAMHLFDRLHHATGESLFRDAALRWFEHVFELRRSGDAIAGFPASTPSSETQWTPDATVLTGAPGVALALHAMISEVEPSWDRVMLIDF